MTPAELASLNPSSIVAKDGHLYCRLDLKAEQIPKWIRVTSIPSGETTVPATWADEDDLDGAVVKYTAN